MFERCLYFNINALTRQINRIWKEAFKEVGLSPSYAYLLRLVLNEPGLSQQAIADVMKLEKSTITRFIVKMEDEGFIQRKVPANRNTREQSVYPTEKAKRLQSELERIGDQLYEDMQQIVGADQLGKLVRDLRTTSGKF